MRIQNLKPPQAAIRVPLRPFAVKEIKKPEETNMNNREWTPMNANEQLLLKNEVFMIVGFAMEVLNELGHGLHEKPYENALVVEFGLRPSLRRGGLLVASSCSAHVSAPEFFTAVQQTARTTGRKFEVMQTTVIRPIIPQPLQRPIISNEN